MNIAGIEVPYLSRDPFQLYLLLSAKAMIAESNALKRNQYICPALTSSLIRYKQIEHVESDRMEMAHNHLIHFVAEGLRDPGYEENKVVYATLHTWMKHVFFETHPDLFARVMADLEDDEKPLLSMCRMAWIDKMIYDLEHPHEKPLR